MNKGFSLVELIVVIAIMAILVGVAVPVYTSYISEAKDGVDAQYFDELERAVNTLVIDIDANVTDAWKDYNIPNEIEWTTSGWTLTYNSGVTENGFETALATLIKETNATADSDDYTIDLSEYATPAVAGGNQAP